MFYVSAALYFSCSDLGIREHQVKQKDEDSFPLWHNQTSFNISKTSLFRILQAVPES